MIMPENGHTTKNRINEPKVAGQTPDAEPSGPEAAKQLFAHFAELREYLSYLAAAKADRFKYNLRSMLAAAALGVVGLLAAFALILISVWQLLSGIAGGLAEALERAWLGNLITGGVFLAIIGIGVWVGISRWKSGSREGTLQKYEQRKRRQKSKFGRDVQQAASERPTR